MAEKKNTYYEYTFADGSKVKMTLTFFLLNRLKSKNKDLYDRYNGYRMNGSKDILEWVEMLYVAYLCANMDDYNNCLSEDEFIEKCGNDFEAVTKAVTILTTPKKA